MSGLSEDTRAGAPKRLSDLLAAEGIVFDIKGIVKRRRICGFGVGRRSTRKMWRPFCLGSIGLSTNPGAAAA